MLEFLSLQTGIRGSKHMIKATTKLLIVINIISISAYLYFASLTWGQEALPILVRSRVSMDLWIKHCLPIAQFSCTANLVWIILILARAYFEKIGRALVCWLLIITLWLTVFGYDYYRFYRETSPIDPGVLNSIERDRLKYQPHRNN